MTNLFFGEPSEIEVANDATKDQLELLVKMYPRINIVNEDGKLLCKDGELL